MFNEIDLGFEYRTPFYILFFGKKNCTLECLQQTYPQFLFRQTLQSHSDILIKSTTGSELTNADAQWTTEKNVALVVKTADCIPVFIYDEDNHIILSIHAGWRGVQNQITKKSLDQLQLSTKLKIYIGPHIQKNSFACDLDVKNLLNPKDSEFEDKNNKYYIDLKNILLSQINSNNFINLDIDTVTNLNFNSHRRDKENSGRNLSFIVKV